MTLGAESTVTQEEQLTAAAGRCCSSHNKVKKRVAAYSSLSNTRNTAISATPECKRGLHLGRMNDLVIFEWIRKQWIVKLTTVRNI